MTRDHTIAAIMLFSMLFLKSLNILSGSCDFHITTELPYTGVAVSTTLKLTSINSYWPYWQPS